MLRWTPDQADGLGAKIVTHFSREEAKEEHDAAESSYGAWLPVSILEGMSESIGVCSLTQETQHANHVFPYPHTF